MGQTSVFSVRLELNNSDSLSFDIDVRSASRRLNLDSTLVNDRIDAIPQRFYSSFSPRPFY